MISAQKALDKGHYISVFQRFGIIALAQDGYIILPGGCNLYCGTKYPSLNRTGDLCFHESQLGKLDVLFRYLDGSVVVLCCIMLDMILFGTVFRISGSSAEKLTVGIIQIPEGGLQGCRIGVIQKEMVFILFQSSEFFRTAVISRKSFRY